jgi:hypothetical protein
MRRRFKWTRQPSVKRQCKSTDHFANTIVAGNQEARALRFWATSLVYGSALAPHSPLAFPVACGSCNYGIIQIVRTLQAASKDT